MEESQIYSLLSEYKGLLKISKEKFDTQLAKQKGSIKSQAMSEKDLRNKNKSDIDEAMLIVEHVNTGQQRLSD